MLKVVRFVLITCIISMQMLLGFSFSAKEKIDILYISSYSPSLTTHSEHINGFREGIEGVDYNLYIQYMNSKMFFSETIINNFKNQLKEILAMKDFDLIVVADDNAYNLALEEKEQIFKDLPIVFLGVSDRENALKANEIPQMTGVIEEVSIKKTIDVGLDVKASAKNIYIITDPTTTGQSVFNSFKPLVKGYPNVNFIILDTSNMTSEVLATKINQISSEDFVLLLSFYRDISGNFFSFSEGLSFLMENTQAPIFGLYKFGVGKGLVGGYVLDHYRQGYSAGTLVKKYLDSGSLEGVTVIDESPNAFYFDYEMVKKYNLSMDLLPENTILINNKPNVFETYGHYIIAFGLLFVFESVLIFYLLYNLNKRKEYERTIVRNNEILEMQNEEIRVQYEELEDTKEALGISRSRYELAFQGSDSGLFDINHEINSNYITAKWYSQFLKEPLDTSDDFAALIQLIPSDDQANYKTLKDGILKGNDDVYDLEFPILVEGYNDKRWIQENGVILRDPLGEVIRVIGSHRDITHMKRNIKQIETLKAYDQLTKLHNKIALEVYLKGLLSKDLDTTIAIIYIDLDNFKNVNEEYGHNIGDEILETIANRMMQSNVADYICRFGGDEFVIVIKDTEDIEMLIENLYGINYFIEKKIILNSKVYNMHGSFGVVLSPRHGSDYHDLMRKADLAMYEVKNSGDDTWYRIYDESISEAFKEKVKLLEGLKEGLFNHEFHMVYQPIVDTISGKIFSVESLMRWEHKGKIIPPDEFIPLAESNGLINELTRISIEQSIQCLSSLNEVLNISINFSPLQLKDSELLEFLEKTIEAYGVSYEKIMIEITETAIIDDFKETIKVLERMKSLGLRIAFDDFGTGYSSLSYLAKLPVDFIKIDKSFVKEINKSKQTMNLISAIIAIARNGQLQVVFEGVETKEQLNYIVRSGCRYAQGYYYYKPLEEESLKKLISRLSNE